MHTGQLIDRLINTTNLRHPHSSTHKFTETKTKPCSVPVRSLTVPGEDHGDDDGGGEDDDDDDDEECVDDRARGMCSPLRSAPGLNPVTSCSISPPPRLTVLGFKSARSQGSAPPLLTPPTPGCPRTDRTLNLFVRTSEASGAMCGFCIM